MFRRTTAIILVGLSCVAAQSLNVSSQCQSTLVTTLGSPDGQCLNPAGLVPLLASSGNQSFVQPFSNWVQGVCTENACTNASLSAVVTNITTGCASDLAGLGFTNDSLPVLISTVQEAYPVLRSILCLEDTTNNTLCVSTLLNQIQQVTGPLTLVNISSFAQLITGASSDLPEFITCSDCVKEGFNIAKQQFPQIANSSAINSTLESQCGASFLDGQAPTEILEGTGSTSTSASATSTVVVPASSGSSVATESGASPALAIGGVVAYVALSMSALVGAFLVLL